MPIAKAEPGKTRVGWIGTGVMGRWMCQHLINKGYSATVYNRTREKAQPLLDAEPDPSPERIREAISGQLCRCTGYENIVRAIRWAASREREQAREVAS